jgi:hypothetical protein
MNPPEDELELDDPPPLFTMASDVYAFAMTVIEVYFLHFFFQCALLMFLFVITVLRSALPPIVQFILLISFIYHDPLLRFAFFALYPFSFTDRCPKSELCFSR